MHDAPTHDTEHRTSTRSAAIVELFRRIGLVVEADRFNTRVAFGSAMSWVVLPVLVLLVVEPVHRLDAGPISCVTLTRYNTRVSSSRLSSTPSNQASVSASVAPCVTSKSRLSNDNCIALAEPRVPFGDLSWCGVAAMGDDVGVQSGGASPSSLVVELTVCSAGNDSGVKGKLFSIVSKSANERFNPDNVGEVLPSTPPPSTAFTPTLLSSP